MALNRIAVQLDPGGICSLIVFAKWSDGGRCAIERVWRYLHLTLDAVQPRAGQAVECGRNEYKSLKRPDSLICFR